MNKQEKLEKLLMEVQELDLSLQEVIDFFETKAHQQSLKRFIPKIGMFCYEDHTFSEELIAGKIVSGVVGMIENRKALIVGLKEEKMKWSGGALKIPETRMQTSGEKATSKILEIAEEQGLNAYAAQWCRDYSYGGVGKGQAFLPSLSELEQLSKNQNQINASLELIGAPLLKKWCWTSNEHSKEYVWIWGFVSSFKSGGYKFDSYHVRPVFWVAF